jgi:hypothetical protein
MFGNNCVAAHCFFQGSEKTMKPGLTVPNIGKMEMSLAFYF